MLINVKKSSDLTDNDVTDQQLYLNRRKFMQLGALTGASALINPAVQAGVEPPGLRKALDYQQNKRLSTDEKLTPFEDVSGYTNFYEFGTAKDDPPKNAGSLKTRPWKVTVEGHAEKTGDFDFEDIIKGMPLEERIYRFRCVEAWSMVVPWVGFELGKLLKRFKPTSKAKYVEFTTLYNLEQMPGQRRQVLDWPYVEGLRMDEAMHPLAMMVVGLYGEVLPNQNGAPLRLMVPWKYGFKSIKSIVKIRFAESQPVNSWQQSAPREYGFFANVNPQVDHPRWSQKRERRIGEGYFLFNPKRETLMFNGYADQVASLYSGMDLKKHF